MTFSIEQGNIMNKIITISIAFLAIFILTGCIKSKPLDISINQTDTKPFTIADADALKVKEEVTSKEEITVVEEPVIISKTLKETETEKEKKEEEAISMEKPITVATTDSRETVEKVQEEEQKQEKVLTLNYYIQVMSFSEYPPSKKFLDSITALDYTYKLHEVTKNLKTTTKVLVGPFSTEKKARDIRIILRAEIDPGSFLVMLNEY